MDAKNSKTQAKTSKCQRLAKIQRSKTKNNTMVAKS